MKKLKIIKFKIKNLMNKLLIFKKKIKIKLN